MGGKPRGECTTRIKKNWAGPCPSRPSHLQLPRPLGTQALRKPLVLKQGLLKKRWVLLAQVGAAKVRHPTSERDYVAFTKKDCPTLAAWP